MKIDSEDDFLIFKHFNELIWWFYLFNFDCAGSSLLRGLFCRCSEQGVLYGCGAQASHCSGSSRFSARRISMQASACRRAGISNCSVWARSTGLIAVQAQGLSCSTACGIFLDQRIEPMSPALAGGLFTTEPPGKPYLSTFR